MTDNTNLAIWERLGKTDPAHTKGFNRAGGFKGTAIKPVYTTQKMTEEFGPAGEGWGMSEPSFQLVPGSDGQLAVFCTVSLWWKSPAHVVYGVGGDMVVVKQSSGLRTDDEAFKKAFTDALGNAMKHLGMSADVHMGLFDDSKYVSDLKREFAEDAVQPRDDGPKPMVKDQRVIDGELRKEIEACGTVEELERLWRSALFQDEFHKLKSDWQDALIDLFKETKADRQATPAVTPRGYVEPVFPPQ